MNVLTQSGTNLVAHQPIRVDIHNKWNEQAPISKVLFCLTNGVTKDEDCLLVQEPHTFHFPYKNDWIIHDVKFHIEGLWKVKSWSFRKWKWWHFRHRTTPFRVEDKSTLNLQVNEQYWICHYFLQSFDSGTECVDQSQFWWVVQSDGNWNDRPQDLGW